MMTALTVLWMLASDSDRPRTIAQWDRTRCQSSVAILRLAKSALPSPADRDVDLIRQRPARK